MGIHFSGMCWDWCKDRLPCRVPYIWEFLSFCSLPSALIILQDAGVCSLGHHLRLCFDFFMLSQRLWWYSFLGSVRGYGCLAQLALTSSHFEWVGVKFLMVRSTACPTVLRPLPDFVVLPTLHSPVAVSLPFLFFFLCIILHISLFSSSVLLWVAGYLFLWGLLAWRGTWVPAGLFFSPWYRHCRFYGLVPRRLVSSLFQFDRHSVEWPCLPCSWDPPVIWLRRCFSLWDCRCVPWFGYGCFVHLPPTVPPSLVWHFTG